MSDKAILETTITAWYSSLPLAVQWLIVSPFVIYVLGMFLLSSEPSAWRDFEGKWAWIAAPMGMRLVVAVFLATIFGPTYLLSYVLPYWLAFIISLPLGPIFIFGLIQWTINKTKSVLDRFKRKSDS